MRNFIVLLVLSVLLLSCDGKQVFDVYKTLPKHWDKDEAVVFNFKNPDSINKYNLFINLRNTNAYEFSNLYLIVSLTAPNNNETIDTLAYQMAKPNGEWLGEGFATKENKLFFKENYQFVANGNYTVNITHAMRKNGNVLGEDSLKGITEVGFRIEKIKD